jgi:antitoxin (DNA-binding transcriptional repressor) of toxin-antitoxin stability system
LVKNAYFCLVKATLTNLRRDTGRVLGKVIHGQESVELTQHGQVVAEIQPRPRPMTGAEFAAMWKARRPLGKDAAQEVAEALRALDAAG